MKLKIYRIEGKGYVCKGKCFESFYEVSEYIKKYYNNIYNASEIIDADERTTAYWKNHWNGV